MGRGRRYDFKPLENFKSSEVAIAAAMLDEAAERVYDVLGEADLEKLNYIPEGSYLSIARLVKHMAWGEAVWIAKIVGKKAPEELLESFGNPGPQNLRTIPRGDETAEELCDAIRRLRSGYTMPALASVVDIEARIVADNGPRTVREILSHLIWHWTYHSGQVGLTLLQAGYDYQWTFATGEER